MDAIQLVIIGLGYTGSAIARGAAARGWTVVITTRNPAAAVPLPGAAIIPFQDARPALASATHLLQTAPPRDDGDPFLRQHGGAAMPGLRWAGLLSTTGVYGDRGGAWVDEDTAPAPSGPRGQRRMVVEQDWRTAFARCAVDLFRVAGIYGPGRSALDDVREGTARRISKPGHLFGRIHRDDIAAAVLAAIAQRPPPGARVLNLSDAEPASSADVVAEAARLLGQPAPPLIPFAEAWAGMSPMARSFWAENRRVASQKTQERLGMRWRFPTYREGLAAILEQEAREGAPE